MPEQDFDLAIGLDRASLNTGISELHGKHHDALFKGSESKPFNGQQAVATWDVKSAPTVTLGPPSQEEWNKATDAHGRKPPANPLPQGNVLHLTLNKTDFSIAYGTAHPLSVTDKNIDIYASVSVPDGKLAVTLLAIQLDTTGMKQWDEFFLQKLVVPNLLTSGSNALSQLTIPTQELFGTKLQLVPDRALVTGTHLVLGAAANIEGNTTPDPLPTDFRWPDKPLWALFSRRLTTWVLNNALRQEVVGKPQHYAHTQGIITVSVDYRLRSYQNLTLDPARLTAGSAALDMAYDAKVSVLGIDPDKCALFSASKGM